MIELEHIKQEIDEKEYVRTSDRAPESVPILEGSDFCKGNFMLENGQITGCMLGWFRTAFCHEEIAMDFAERENPNDEYGEPEYGIATFGTYKNWRPRALQTIIKECKNVDKHAKFKSFYTQNKNGRNFQNPDEVMSFNDDGDRRYDTLARIWNRAMAKLGYVEGNPEA